MLEKQSNAPSPENSISGLFLGVLGVFRVVFISFSSVLLNIFDFFSRDTVSTIFSHYATVQPFTVYPRSAKKLTSARKRIAQELGPKSVRSIQKLIKFKIFPDRMERQSKFSKYSILYQFVEKLYFQKPTRTVSKINCWNLLTVMRSSTSNAIFNLSLKTASCHLVIILNRLDLVK